MESSNLGDRKAFRNSVFLQHRGETGGLSANLGLRMDDQNRWGTEVSPSASVAFTPVADLTLRVAGARGIRPPSFTERYYRDPRNTGNPDLQPEQSWGYEAGFDLRCPRNIRLSVTGFRADAEDLIDWTRSAGDQPWVAMNISKTVSQGVETSLAGPVGPLRWQLSYCYLDLDVDSNGLESKYALNAPQHDTRLGLTLPEWNLFSGSMHVRYRDVPTLDSYSWVSARMARRFGRLTAFVQGQNLLDEDYEEIPGVPTSGRYTEAGVEMRW